MEYNFRYKLTEDDFAEFNSYTMWTAHWQRKFRLLYVIKIFATCVVAMIATFIISKKNSNENISYNIFFVFVPLFSILITWIFYNRAAVTIKNKAKKLLEKEDNQHFLNEAELILSEDNLIAIDKLSTVKYSWESIVRYAVTNEYFYLYTNSIQGLVIPKRLLKDKKEIDDLDKFITGKIPLSSSFRSLGI